MMCIICKNIYYNDYLECVVYKSFICIRCLLTINIMNFKYKELHILYRYKCLLCNYYQKIKKYNLFIKIKFIFYSIKMLLKRLKKY
jgi:hypothetical protein